MYGCSRRRLPFLPSALLAAATDATAAAGRPWTIVGNLGMYLELQRAPAKLDKLQRLLEEWPYAGPDTEAEEVAEAEAAMTVDAAPSADTAGRGAAPRRKRYSLLDLMDRVPASDAELQMGLRALEAVELDGTDGGRPGGGTPCWANWLCGDVRFSPATE